MIITLITVVQWFLPKGRRTETAVAMQAGDRVDGRPAAAVDA
jgi:hypothetical protein